MRAGQKAHYLAGLRAAAAEESAAEQLQVQQSKRIPDISQDHCKQPCSATMQTRPSPAAAAVLGTAENALAASPLDLAAWQPAAVAFSCPLVSQPDQPYGHAQQYMPASSLTTDASCLTPTMSLLQALRHQQHQLQAPPLSSAIQPCQAACQVASLHPVAGQSSHLNFHHTQQHGQPFITGLQSLGSVQVAQQHAHDHQPQQQHQHVPSLLPPVQQPEPGAFSAYLGAPWQGLCLQD